MKVWQRSWERDVGWRSGSGDAGYFHCFLTPPLQSLTRPSIQEISPCRSRRSSTQNRYELKKKGGGGGEEVFPLISVQSRPLSSVLGIKTNSLWDLYPFDKHINATVLFLLPFSWAKLKDQRFFLNKGPFLWRILGQPAAGRSTSAHIQSLHPRDSPSGLCNQRISAQTVRNRLREALQHAPRRGLE